MLLITQRLMKCRYCVTLTHHILIWTVIICYLLTWTYAVIYSAMTEVMLLLCLIYSPMAEAMLLLWPQEFCVVLSPDVRAINTTPPLWGYNKRKREIRQTPGNIMSIASIGNTTRALISESIGNSEMISAVIESQ